MSINLKIPEINLKQEDIKILLAIKLFEEGITSLGKASEIAGYSEKAFSELLLNRGIAPIKYENINLKKESLNA